LEDHKNNSGEQSPSPAASKVEPAQHIESPACPVDGLCPVVGIGASAGGLEALTQLLQALPSATGLGFVIIQHLDPHHESSLAPLLAHQTAMPVVQAVDGTLVEPNHVYVIPPNTKMAIFQGRLVISPRLRENGRHLPVDFFLCSLAENQRQCAIGVILSGTGSDGTLGLEAIKSESGITFAQDESARFDGMPRQAAAAGVVDFVMPPAGIARELEVIARHLQNGAGRSGIQNGPDLQRIFAILRDHSGVDFTHYKLNTVARRLSRRLALMHANSLNEYLQTLDRHPEEIAALFNDLLITVTDFFRDEPAFAALCQSAFPYILKNHQENDPVRVWVAGCASGKEVYSLAIALTEYLESTGRRHLIQIFGTDVNEQAIHAARSGRFPENITASVSTERLGRFFLKTEGGYQISRQIRDLCIFSRQDVTKDPPLSKMDLISCRNLLIYFRPTLQRRVISIFGHALNPRGCLFLGNSETVGNLSDQLHSIDSHHKIFARNLEAAPAGFERNAPAYHRPAPVPRLEDATIVDHAADRILLDEYAPSGFLLNAAFEVVKFRGDVGPYLHPPPGDPSLNALTLVRPDISGILREALMEASQSNRIVRGQLLQVRRNDGHHEVRLIVRPMHEMALDPHYLVIFEDASQRARREALSPTAHTTSASSDQAISDLTLELASTRIYMQRLIEELRSANEEAQSSNEELQSTNEELQTAKEELQSSNEELTTTNEEMQSRNTELSLLNSDLVNLLTSLEVPIIMLNGDLHIRRYTPVAAQLFKLIPTDIGRPFSDLRPALDFPDLQKTLLDVMESARAFHGEVRTINGHWYSVSIHPYRALAKSGEGVVMQLIDI
jgi:two-component system CheB/CheR fusion protein